MMKSTELYSEAERRFTELKSVAEYLEAEMKKYQKGDMYIAKYKDRAPQFYFRINPKEKTGTYIPISEQKLIHELAQKKYDSKVVKLIHKEIDALNRFIAAGDFPKQIQQEIMAFPECIRGALTPVDLTDEEYVNRWMAMQFTPKKIGENVPEYYTDRNEHVRSKSEVNIANALNKLGIPYRYECPLTLKNGITIYPDFTVLHVGSRKVMYWEHLGMMDDREYSKNALYRIRDYEDNNLYPGKELILTFETAARPLSTKDIRKTIDAYF